MPLETDVQSFISWAISLGYPLENMPNEDALKSIFKSRQSSLFFNLMEKVRPRQNVIEIRQNILINKMENLKDQVVPMCKRCFLPREMQRYLKIQDIQKENKEYEIKLNEEKENSNPDTIKIKNLQKIKMTNIRDTLKTKLNILELKLDSLTEQCKKEIKTSEKIDSIIPVQLTAINSNEILAGKGISDALKELEEFYKISMINTNPELINVAKEELWLNLKKIFLNIPNSILFNIILRLKEEQLQNIKLLNNKYRDERNKKSSIDNVTIFDIHMTKLKSTLIILIGKYISVLKQFNNQNETFTSIYTQFTNSVQSKINFFQTDLTLLDDEIEEILSDYIVEYSRYNFNKSQIEFLNNEIDRIKKITADNQNQLNDHQVLMGSLKHIYNDIMITVQRVQQELNQLTEIKDKICYTKSLLQYMLKDIQVTRKKNPNKLNISGGSTIGGESFNFSDNILCSTKLDFDSTTISNLTVRSDINNTLISTQNNGGNGIFPSYNTELTIFMETPISKFHIMSKECWPYLLPNPLILESYDSITNLHFCPGILFTVDGSLKYMKSKINWYKKIKEISNEVQNNISLIKVDQNDFKCKIKHQHEEIIEILDKIDVFNINTNRTLQKAEKYFQFILNNPLKNYIPKTKLFNNQTYFDYDAEYSMYYRMSTTGVSIQQ